MRRALVIAGGVALISTLAVAALAASGSREVYDGPSAAAPEWARPCYRSQPRPDRELLHRCARIRGRVIHVRHEEADEIHLAVLAHWRLVIVKLPLGTDPPARGSMVTAVGPLLRIKHRLYELQAFRVGG